MATPTLNLPSQVISTADPSVSTGLGRILSGAVAISILSPATLTASQATVEVEYTDTGTSWVTLLSGGSPVVIPAGSAIVINPFPFRQLRLTSTTVETSARTFQLLATMPV